MRRRLITILSLMPLSLASASVSSWSLQFRTGYDSNVLRLSTVEQNSPLSVTKILGNQSTFDSEYLRLGGRLNWQRRFRADDTVLRQAVYAYWTDYVHAPARGYPSIGWTGDFSWGPYRHVRGRVTWLNHYYLRRYIDRDQTLDQRVGCYFSDLDHRLEMTQPVMRRTWISSGVGFLQRYYSVPFTEFDLDITYGSFGLHRDWGRSYRTALNLTYGWAKNRGLHQTARASRLDRSYHYVEGDLPLLWRRPARHIREIGLSVRQEWRYYMAESSEDVLHSGRSHTDTQGNAWVRVNLAPDWSLKIQGRVRYRQTHSRYARVEDLKSFHQVLTWVEIAKEFEHDWK
ncbi:MAG: hypothetical protein D6762_00730 [Candidatus Neomarinimicrobiota bacterium]|nr:MAG: hypothetical protein D6762_00730 [Candidatus Neomarinimicrobiota bacterium]